MRVNGENSGADAVGQQNRVSENAENNESVNQNINDNVDVYTSSVLGHNDTSQPCSPFLGFPESESINNLTFLLSQLMSKLDSQNAKLEKKLDSQNAELEKKLDSQISKLDVIQVTTYRLSSDM